ncbi:hypothetical protein [Microvirga terricola]|uniref:Uncharacterized protein n=1 Tax=Microvirga terricola TaxID=2719797 RepID=A0ABX0VE40_9HYPH|nr:hypothetical protein [Microvirga terricola]NIX78100.1 hypothetical protein [Microvirga terricola]
MKRIALAALALALTAPASAQYYGNPYPPPPAPEWGGPPPGYRHEWRRPAPRQRVGNVCYTSRGSCEYPQYFPINTPCRCDIPGFGMKRGAILY